MIRGSFFRFPSGATGLPRVSLFIVLRDSSEQDEQTIYGPAPYVLSKEFQDRAKTAHLQLNGPVDVMERMFIVIQVNDDGTIDESDSYFNLATHRTRQGL